MATIGSRSGVRGGKGGARTLSSAAPMDLTEVAWRAAKADGRDSKLFDEKGSCLPACAWSCRPKHVPHLSET